MYLDRREILLGGLTTLAAGAAAPTLADAEAVAPSLKGPYVDLTTPRGNMIALARLVADLDLGKQKAGWYNGYVCGVRPGEAVRDLFGFAGFGMAGPPSRVVVL